MWVPLPALLCEFTGFYELYANHSARAGLIHHLGSRGWMDGWLSSSPHTPQPPAICRNWLLARAGPAGKRGGGQWDAHSSPSSWKWFSSLHTTFPQEAQKDPSKVRCEDGVLGAPENSSSVRKPSGTCLAHHRVWGTAKDPTVIQVSFFPAK